MARLIRPDARARDSYLAAMDELADKGDGVLRFWVPTGPARQ